RNRIIHVDVSRFRRPFNKSKIVSNRPSKLQALGGHRCGRLPTHRHAKGAISKVLISKVLISEVLISEVLISEVLGSPLHGMVPDVIAIVVEDDLGIYWRHEPGVAREFALQLIGSPSGIAKGNETLARTAIVPDGAQDLGMRRHRHAPVDIDRFRSAIIGTVD